MQPFIVTVFVLCIAPPFAFYVLYTVMMGRAVSTDLIKAWGVLLVTTLVLALASTDVRWFDTLGPVLTIVSEWIKK